ncbi:MAG: hypothetical protein RBT44_08870 [Sphaerochaetaceae bacterium]|jgi:hypothetical protein|nr:hypothetical protein [Sphaerochaetaceae bacterium]
MVAIRATNWRDRFPSCREAITFGGIEWFDNPSPCPVKLADRRVSSRSQWIFGKLGVVAEAPGTMALDRFWRSWRSIEEFDSDTLVNSVERVVIKQDGIDVVMKYRQMANS